MQAVLGSSRLCGPVGLVRSSRQAFLSVRCSASGPQRVSIVPGLSLTRPIRPASFVSPRRSSLACSSVPDGKFISKTEVPAFIQRDDIMDQLFRWSMMEAGESGQRNFGLPMKIEPTYWEGKLWGFNVAIFKEGAKLTDLGVFFDKETVSKHEWVGRGEDGFPIVEGKVDEVRGKNIEIWCVRRAGTGDARGYRGCAGDEGRSGAWAADIETHRGGGRMSVQGRVAALRSV